MKQKKDRNGNFRANIEKIPLALHVIDIRILMAHKAKVEATDSGAPKRNHVFRKATPRGGVANKGSICEI